MIQQIFSTDAQFYEPAPNFAPFMATLELGMKQGLEAQTMARRWSDNTDNSNRYFLKHTSILQKHKGQNLSELGIYDVGHCSQLVSVALAAQIIIGPPKSFEDWMTLNKI
jgi:hypothetical protein